MNKQTWIPQPNETVKWKGKLTTIISCNLGGKCKIKGVTIKKTFSDIDISELEKLS